MARHTHVFRQARPFITALIVLVGLGAASRRAAAQDAASPPDQATQTPAALPAPRVIVDLDAGTAFGNTEAHLAYIGGVGVSLGSHIEVSAELGRFDNIVTRSTHDLVRDTSAQLSAADGTLVQSSTSAPAEYGLGDIRLWGECSPRIGLFLDAGVGVGYEHPALAATAGGTDVSAQVLQTVMLGAARTSVFVSGGGGVTIRITRRATIDAGYRFARLGSTSPAYTNTLYGGWKLGWR